MKDIITSIEQEKIDQAAKEYATVGSFREWMELKPFRSESNFSATQRHFKAGVAFALSELCPAAEAERAQGLVEALNDLIKDINRSPCGARHDTALTAAISALTKYNNSK